MSGGGFVVSGGTGALGRAVVAALLRRGARVAVPFRSAAAWDALRAAAGPDAALWGSRADLADPGSAAAFMDEAAGWLGGVEGVAALAGAYAGSGRLEAAPVQEWEDMLRANLSTVYGLCRAALPHLTRRGGSVVTVASRLAEAGGAGAAAYAVSKAAVVTLTRVLALENRDRGVRFNCVMPAIIDTPANRSAMPAADSSGWTPPEAVARVVVFLLSPESAAVTGAVVPVDASPFSSAPGGASRPGRPGARTRPRSPGPPPIRDGSRTPSSATETPLFPAHAGWTTDAAGSERTTRRAPRPPSAHVPPARAGRRPGPLR